MRIMAKIEGVDPPAWLRGRSRLAAQAITAGVHAAMTGAHHDIRAMIAAAGMGRRLGNAVRLHLYPKPPAYSPRAAADIVANRNAADIIEAFEEGVSIQGKPYLAIPTKDIPRGRYGVKLTPREVEMHFLQKLEYRVLGGKPCLVLPQARLGRRGARAASMRQVARGQGMVVVAFWLVRSVNLRKRLSAKPIVAGWVRRLPGIIDRAAAGLRG